MRTHAAADRATSPEALLALYLDELARHHFSRSAQESARLIVPRFFSHLREERVRDVRAAREEHVVSFAKRLSAHETRAGQPLSHATKVHYLNRVKAFLRFLEEYEAQLAVAKRTHQLLGIWLDKKSSVKD